MKFMGTEYSHSSPPLFICFLFCQIEWFSCSVLGIAGRILRRRWAAVCLSLPQLRIVHVRSVYLSVLFVHPVTYAYLNRPVNFSIFFPPSLTLSLSTPLHHLYTRLFFSRHHLYWTLWKVLPSGVSWAGHYSKSMVSTWWMMWSSRYCSCMIS